MGQNNRARRKMKAGARRGRGRAQGGGGEAFSGSGSWERAWAGMPHSSAGTGAFGGAGGAGGAGRDVDRLVSDALVGLDLGYDNRLDDAAVALAQRCASADGRRTVVATLVGGLTDATSDAWQRGWQPADVHRYVGRRRAAAEQALILDVMSHELAGYAPATIDRGWQAQLIELEGGIWWPAEQTVLDAHRERGVDWLTLITRALVVLHLLLRLPRLERLTPLPGTVPPPERSRERDGSAPGAGTGRQAADEPAVDERILSRVRQLLAKAESTNFEAEAETFTAGAQALMARHSIDAALLAASDPARRRADAVPHGRRIGLDNPYDGPKAMLLNAVAAANRCRMIWSREFGFGTVVGFEADLESVELLFTSLLVQATRAVTAAGARTDANGRSRTRSFRHSFLMSFAGRIGERLQQVTADEVQAAATTARAGGRELVPILEARAEDVDRAIEDWFPEVQSTSITVGRDAEGWHSGRAAADRAHLGSGPPIQPT